MVVDCHVSFMGHALRLARRGMGFVEPNPMVGAVLVRNGKVVAGGWHKKFGGPHAEIEALGDAKRQRIDVSGCDMYVTLEPCCHHGKTPPCTDALIASKLARVWVAMADPFGKVDGGGIAQLRKAGIEVNVGVCQDKALELNEPYLKRLSTGLPWVIAKWAQTLDGRIATASGDSRWISNERSRQVVHALRARVDAVMVGIGTVLSDDPQLTARHGRIRRTARLVVIDPDLHLPPDARLLQSGSDVTIAVSQALIDRRTDKAGALEARGIELFGLHEAASGDAAKPLRPLLEHLATSHGATNVLVEGGAGLLGSLFAQGLIDQVIAFVAPKVIGDLAAISAVRGLECELIEHARVLTLRSVKRLGEDVMLDYRVPRQN